MPDNGGQRRAAGQRAARAPHAAHPRQRAMRNKSCNAEHVRASLQFENIVEGPATHRRIANQEFGNQCRRDLIWDTAESNLIAIPIEFRD